MSEKVEQSSIQEKIKPNETNDRPIESQNTIIIYRCPQCRKILFKSTDIIPHEATKLRNFANKRRQYADKSCPCTSFFVEKPKWLDARGRMSDTIYCPLCKYKVGHFSWIGSQHSCGEWIKPSFQFPISRVDDLSFNKYKSNLFL